jgi:hypothetical protein
MFYTGKIFSITYLKNQIETNNSKSKDIIWNNVGLDLNTIMLSLKI